jgi:hypothetical protein
MWRLEIGCQNPAQKALVAQKRGPVEQILAVMNLSIFNANYGLLTVTGCSILNGNFRIS